MFNKESVKITDSYKVTSRYERQKISEIIHRTNGKTNREYDNMSSEWLAHNICFSLRIKPDSTKDVDLDYIKDYSDYVNIGTKILEILGWE